MSIAKIAAASPDGIGLPSSRRPNNVPQSSSFLEALLLCMSADQRAHLLAAFTDGIIYINRVPSCAHTIPLKLTRKAQTQLMAMFGHTPEGTEGSTGSPSEPFVALRADLEAGVRLNCGKPNTTSNSTSETGASLQIESSRFFISCRLYSQVNFRNASLIATHIDRPRTRPTLGASGPLLSLCSWDVLPHDIETPLYFDPATLERIVAEISCKLHPSTYGQRTRDHLDLLEQLINVNRLAMQYHCEVLSRDTDYISLTIKGPSEQINQIALAVFCAEDITGATPASDSRLQPYMESPRRQRKPSIVLKRTEEEGTDTDDDGQDDCIHTFTCASDGEVPPSGLIMDLGTACQFEKQEQAIASLRDGCRKSSPRMIRLTNFLGPVQFAKLEVNPERDSAVEFIDGQLTPRQKQAVIKAISTPDVCLIHGPPGTGKTRVICEIVQQAIARKWTTLLVAPTHVAVDNVLERVGNMDDVNAVRCVSQRRMGDLSDYIQRFTYEQRLGALSRRCIENIDQDLRELQRRRMRIDNAVRILQELLSLRPDLVALEAQRETLRRTVSRLSHDVREEFTGVLEEAQSIREAASLTCAESEKALTTVRSALQRARKRAQRIGLESYTQRDASRFSVAENKVNRSYQKDISAAEARRDGTRENIVAMEDTISQTRSQLLDASEIVHELDAGNIPAHVEAIIRQSLAALSAQHTHAISAASSALEEATNQRDVQQGIRDEWARRLAAVRAKRAILPQIKKGSWWKRPSQFVWWESLLVDHKKQEGECAAQPNDLQNSLAEHDRRVESAELSLQAAIEEEALEIQAARSSELGRLHELYRSQSRTLPVEIAALEQQLDNSRLEYQAAQDAMAFAQDACQDALRSARDSVRHTLRKQAADKLLEMRRQLRMATEHLRAAHHELHTAEENAAMLERRLEDVTEQRGSALRQQLQRFDTVILQHQDVIIQKEKMTEALLGSSVPSNAQEVQDLIHQLPLAKPEIDTRQSFVKEWRAFVEREGEELGRRLANYINLICATTVGIASDDHFGDGAPLEQKEFDLLVMDEAGKVTEPEFLVAAARAKRWVLLGDHKQLPPYYDRKVDQLFMKINAMRSSRGDPALPSAALRESYFEHLWQQLQANEGKYAQAVDLRREMLDTQRRMHPDLALFISDVFYDGLYNSPSDPDFVHSKSMDIPHFNYPVTFIEVCPYGHRRGLEVNLKDCAARTRLELSQTTGYTNPEEADQVVRVLESLISGDAISKEQDALDDSNDRVPVIGVISFYAGQVELIRRLIMRSDVLEAEINGDADGEILCKGRIRLMVNSVDSFQGRECPIIILSFTRSNPYKNIGFVDDPNRLNVAMSRARKKLILIGDTNTFRNRSRASNEEIKDCRNDAANQAEHDFFMKLMTYIEGHGEFKKVFHVRESQDESVEV